MKQKVLIAILCAAICSCTKENPIPAASMSVPMPWKPNGLTPQTSTFAAARSVDCMHVPAPTPKTVCKKGGSGNGGGGDDSCCRLAPPPTR